MEQGQINNISVRKEVISVSTFFYSLIALAIVLALYFMWWVPRQNCSNLIQYNPAGTRTTEGYYTVGDSLVSRAKFKTKEEAISHCMLNRK